MKTIILSLILAASALAQTTINGSRTILGRLDASGGTSTAPFKAGKPEIKLAEALVVLTAKLGDEPLKVKVRMAMVEGAWLVDQIQAAK